MTFQALNYITMGAFFGLYVIAPLTALALIVHLVKRMKDRRERDQFAEGLRLLSPAQKEDVADTLKTLAKAKPSGWATCEVCLVTYDPIEQGRHACAGDWRHTPE